MVMVMVLVNYGGTITGAAQSTLNGAFLRIQMVQDGSGTAIRFSITTGFPATGGTIAVGNELITYHRCTGRFNRYY